VAAPLLRVALTGGIASGKSVCLKRFVALGAPVIDADLLARAAVEPGTPEFEAVVRRFGPAVLQSSGGVDRATLGRLVFADDQARRDLEAIVHPYVYRQIRDWFRDLAAQRARAGGARVIGIADIPLLFESDGAREFDQVLVAYCPPTQQISRLVARGLTDTEARQRLAAQWPLEDKRRLADIVIDTTGTIEETVHQVDRAWERLSAGSS
jgi:dephospho-CoA kinase